MNIRRLEIDQFVGFLPYGFISKKALSLLLSASEQTSAYIDYDPDITMEERVEKCYTTHRAANRLRKLMSDGGYAESGIFKYGAKCWMRYEAVRLTIHGLYLLAGYFDDDTEEERINQCMMAGDSEFRAFNYIRVEDYSRDCLSMLRQKITASQESLPVPGNTSNSTLDELLYASVDGGFATILAANMLKVNDVDLTTKFHHGRSMYREWRLSNIEALFRVNSFLTSIDRRPLELKSTPDLKADIMENTPVETVASDTLSDYPELAENEENNPQKKGGYTVRKFTFETLEKWYRNHPQSYLFNAPEDALFDPEKPEKTEKWKATPAFYSVYELPGTGVDKRLRDGAAIPGAANNFKRSFLGVAVGAAANYLVYHTQPVRTPWHEKTEENSALIVQEAINRAGGSEGLMGTDRYIDHAIMVCHTVDQFVKLFENASVKMPNRWKKIRRVVAPYDSVYIVPINASGAMQLRGLMLMHPYEYEDTIIKSLCGKNSKFHPSDGQTFRLTYKSVPVLVAHTMSLQRLFDAWEEYQEGKRFLVSCYPQQTDFIKKLMPGVDFL